jgi:hypothetical protein
MTNPDARAARDLLGNAKTHYQSDLMLAAAQVHATLAVEAAVRELIELHRGDPVDGFLG